MPAHRKEHGSAGSLPSEAAVEAEVSEPDARCTSKYFSILCFKRTLLRLHGQVLQHKGLQSKILGSHSICNSLQNPQKVGQVFYDYSGYSGYGAATDGHISRVASGLELLSRLRTSAASASWR